MNKIELKNTNPKKHVVVDREIWENLIRTSRKMLRLSDERSHQLPLNSGRTLEESMCADDLSDALANAQQKYETE